MRELFDRVLGATLRALLVGIGSLQPDVARELCAAFASFYARLNGERVSIARINLKLAFPDRSQSERDRILVESFANLGRSFAEVCLMHEDKTGSLFDLVSIEGAKNLALAEERSGQPGALIVTAHFGSWEFCAAALAHQGLPVSAVQHGFENRYIEKIVTGWRERAGLETISMGRAALGLFRALARGRYVALLMDQNASAEEGVPANLFEHPAMTRSGPALIAMSRGTAVVPVFFFRVGKTGAHVARIGAPLEMDGEGEGSLARNVERINACVEQAIRESPEQWIWSHRRFKTQLPGVLSIYPSRRSPLRRLRHTLRRTASPS
jgi:KDO2-lipid IV(A) lauroyltransferase